MNWNNTNGCVYEYLSLTQIVAIRYCTSEKKKNPCSTFRYLGCVLQYAIFPHTPAHHALRSLSLFFHFSQDNLAPNCLETRSKNDVFFSSSEAKWRKNGPPAERPSLGIWHSPTYCRTRVYIHIFSWSSILSRGKLYFFIAGDPETNPHFGFTSTTAVVLFMLLRTSI